MGRIKLDKPKDVRYIFRPSTIIQELVNWYMDEHSSTKTQALEALVELGGTVAIKRHYDAGGD